MAVRVNDVLCLPFIFPSGELHVRLESISEYNDIKVSFDKNCMSDNIIELMLVANAIKRHGAKVNRIEIGYLPFGRQDRVAVKKECLSLEVMADIINSINANAVVVIDPHSDVAPALIKNCQVIQQYEVFEKYFVGESDFYIISPDGGALKKIYKLAQEVNPLGVIECSKIRNVRNGEITGVTVHCDDLGGKDCYIVDDICDGGRTFIEIAKILRLKNCGTITLMISHGLFTKGLRVFDGIIDKIITYQGVVYG